MCRSPALPGATCHNTPLPSTVSSETTPMWNEAEIAASVQTRMTCRICGSEPLIPVLDLGDMCNSGAFTPPGAERLPEPRLPLQLVRCDRAGDPGACGLLQLGHTLPGSLLYRSYWYRSGINRSMTENLHEIAEQAAAAVARLASRRSASSTSAATTGRCSTGITDVEGVDVARHGPFGCHAVRGRKGLRRRQRLLQPRALSMRASRTVGLGSSRASRCSTTSSSPATFVADIAALAGRRRRLGERVARTCRRCSR